MNEITTAIYEESNSISPSTWTYILSVSLSILLLLLAGKFVLNLYPQNSEFIEMEKVASETFSQYSQRLDKMRDEYSEEF